MNLLNLFLGVGSLCVAPSANNTNTNTKADTINHDNNNNTNTTYKLLNE